MSNSVYRPYEVMSRALAQASVSNWHDIGGLRAGEVWSADGNQDRFWRWLGWLLVGGEGIFEYMYKDHLGHPTIGVGHLITKLDGNKRPIGRTNEEVLALLNRLPWENNPSHAHIAAQWERLRQAPSGNYRATYYQSYTDIRVSRANVFDLVRLWALDTNRDFNYWNRTTRALGNWQNLPFLSVAAMFTIGWQNPATLTGSSSSAVQLRQALTQKRYFDASVIIANRSRALHQNQPSQTEYNRRDMMRGSAEFFCREECKNRCTNVCPFKESDPPRRPSLPTVQPQPPRPPTVETANQTKHDRYIVQLRAWVPFARYPATDKGPLANYSYKGDGHTQFMGENEKADDPQHRAMVTATFDWHYREENGRKIGTTINPRTLDPVLGSDQRCSSRQTEPRFGKVVRYHTDAQNKWAVEEATFPPNAPDGTRVVWPEAGQNFTSFALQLNAEYPQDVRNIPKLFGSLNVKFENNFLVLDLTCSKFPSFGVRVFRTRDGKTVDLFGGWKTPIYDAYKSYETAKGQLPPLPADQGIGKPGPSQITDVAWLGNALNERFHAESIRIDWTGAPTAAREEPRRIETSGAPAPAARPPASAQKGLNAQEVEYVRGLIGYPKYNQAWRDPNCPLAVTLKAAIRRGIENRNNKMLADYQRNGFQSVDAYVAARWEGSVSAGCCMIAHYLLGVYYQKERRDFTTYFLDEVGANNIQLNTHSRNNKRGWFFTATGNLQAKYSATQVTATQLRASRSDFGIMYRDGHWRPIYRDNQDRWINANHCRASSAWGEIQLTGGSPTPRLIILREHI